MAQLVQQHLHGLCQCVPSSFLPQPKNMHIRLIETKLPPGVSEWCVSCPEWKDLLPFIVLQKNQNKTKQNQTKQTNKKKPTHCKKFNQSHFWLLGNFSLFCRNCTHLWLSLLYENATFPSRVVRWPLPNQPILPLKSCSAEWQRNKRLSTQSCNKNNYLHMYLCTPPRTVIENWLPV